MVAPNRERAVFIEQNLSPNDVQLLHEGMSPNSVLSIDLNGQDLTYILNRRLVFGLMMQCAKALYEQEPGKWVPDADPIS